mmetsp:Transcript_8224/g.16725  ORF Transcript_8224/g.16725 Transcript_8224/m.16725 type:complete len:408 (-) Transcript_8224:1037-2260(-)
MASSSAPEKAQSETSSRRGTNKKHLLAFLFLILLLLTALSLHQQTTMTRSLLPSLSDSVVQQSLTGQSTFGEADLIIQRSFEQSYAHILPCKKSSWKAMDSRIAIDCMQQTRDHIMSQNITVPWWFQTLLRDILAGGGGVYAPWHHFYTTKPPFHFCTVGKVATTEWRKVFCKLNAQDCVDDSSSCRRNCAWKTTQKMPAKAPWAVFVRDPLERLLSGFLDKCYNPRTRKNQGHCEPNVVFNPKKSLMNAKNKTYANLLDSLDIEGQEKAMFGAYVDVLPLKWNVHFVPQAMFCDLHRNIDKYDFVGNMGKDFYFDLDRMANQFGGQLPEILNSTFGYKDHVMSGNHENTGKQGSGHAMHTPAKVARFYTARTVRRALEYLSIDYVMLGLQVPEWARQMLKEESSTI